MGIIFHQLKLKIGLKDEDHESACIWNIMAYIHTKTLIESGDLPLELNNMPKYSKKIKELFT